MSYVKPPGYRVALNFGPESDPPRGYRVALEFVPSTEPPGDSQYLFPTPTVSAEYGTQAVRNAYEYVSPSGVASAAAIGKPGVELQDREVRATGFKATQLYGLPTVINTAHGVFAGGIAPPPQTGPNGNRQVPNPWISYLVRYITPAGRNYLAFGATNVQNWIRYLTPTGANQSKYGKPVVTPGVRLLTPAGFSPARYGSATIQNKTRYLNQTSWTSSIVATGALVWDGKQYATNVTLGDVMFVPSPIVSEPVEPPDDTQVVELSGQGMPIPDNQVWPLLKIENRNKQAFPEGFTSYGLGSPTAEQTIYLTIHPLGADWSVFGTTSVDQTIKKLYPEGFTIGFVSASHQIHNFRTDVVVGGLGSYVSGAHTVARGAARPVVPGIAPKSVVPTGLRVEYRIRALTPTGFSATLWGTANLQSKNIWTYPGGIAPPPQTGPNGSRQVPDPWISYRVRSLLGAGNIKSSTLPSTHNISQWIRYVDQAARGITPRGVGTPGVMLRHREIFPTPVLGSRWGVTTVKRRIFITLTGWDSAFVSDNAELLVNTRRVYYYTGEADQAEYGNATIFKWRQDISLYNQGWYDTQWTPPVVYNLKREIAVGPYADNVDPTTWPNYSPFVDNKTRVLGTFGHQSSRFSVIGNLVENAADPLLPSGLDATIWGPDTSITYRIRYVSPEGWDSLYSTRYAVIYNNAVVLAPQGWDGAQVSTPEQVANLNRTVKHIFPYGGETVGTAFIAYRIRTVYPDLFYDVPSGFPEVRFNPYPISAAGIAPLQFGGHTVYERFTITYPKSANVHSMPWVGEPIIESRNKTLLVFPSEQSLYGLAKVFNYNTHLTAAGDALTVWGSHLISDRTRTITGAPVSMPVFSVTHRIQNVLPDPPARQLIAPNSVYIGEQNRPGIVPSPVILRATIYPEGINEGGYGKLVLTRNTIETRPGIFNLDQVGIPTLILTQYLFPRAIPGSNSGTSDRNWVKPRVTPHTIYAPQGDQATHQARANHPGDSQRIDESVRKGVGSPVVSNQHRTIGPVPRHSGWTPTSRFGNQTLTLSRQYVYPTPIRRPRFGLIMFLNVPQYVNLDATHNGAAPLNAFGQHTIAPPPEAVIPEAKPSGWRDSKFGNTYIENFHRKFSVPGIPHRGNPQQGLTNPWGVPLIGFLREYEMGGWDFTLWGDTWVSHKNRELPVEGWQSSLTEADMSSGFGERGRVTLRNPPGWIPSIESTVTFGLALVAFFARRILSRGISGYNSGNHVVKTVAKIEPAGWDSFEAGDIDRWEAGKIKAHGDDLSRIGTPRTRFRITPTGPSESVVEQPRVGSLAYPLGIPEIGFAGPSVSNPFGCTNRVVAPLPILPQQNVPEPVVNAA